MPDIDRDIYRQYPGSQVLVYGIHPNDPVDLVQDFQEQTQVAFPLVPDQGTRTLYSWPYGVGYPYPRDIVIGKDGTIRSIRNSFNSDEMTALIDELVAE